MYRRPSSPFRSSTTRSFLTKPRMQLSVFFLVLIAGALLLSSPLRPSAVFAEKGEEPSFQPLFDELKVFTDVLALVERDYVSEVEGKRLVQGAIKGMLAALDPHSGYLEPEFYQDLRVQTKGEFGGLGIEITIQDGLLVVVAPMDGSPAEKAGIQAGDKIVKIEGKFTKEFTLVDAVKRLRGPKGSPIEISILREGVPDLIDVTVIRDRIAVRSVRHRMLEPGFGYARISQFVESTGDDLQKSLRELSTSNGGKRLQGLVLDLRNNPGGLLTQAIRVADLFLREGVVVYTDGRIEHQRQKFFAQERGTEPNYPVIILVNEGSASASEIVAGALQDHGRALVLGTQTFGKGSVQTITPLANGGALTLTTALYYTKSGRSIQVTGIVPDIIMEPEIQRPEPSSPPKRSRGARMREGDLPRAIENPNKPERKREKKGKRPPVSKKEGKEKRDLRRAEDIPVAELLSRDIQLQRALELLKTYRRFQPSPTEKA
ncbi:S41 family peptidase [bacterium]|nr:S41 family peptidase [bacterium]